MESQLKVILYASVFTGDKGEIDSVLDDIVKVAKKNNESLGITGVLFYHNGMFVQVAEGSSVSIDGLLAILRNDDRHEKIEVLVDETIDERGFLDWNMDSFNLSNRGSLDFDELRSIRDAFKANLKMESDVILEMYRVMLNT
tara:strand:+ start:433 stop:858 length:426 start_codon:yes stop_codon:yes gene_type:complete